MACESLTVSSTLRASAVSWPCRFRSANSASWRATRSLPSEVRRNYGHKHHAGAHVEQLHQPGADHPTLKPDQSAFEPGADQPTCEQSDAEREPTGFGHQSGAVPDGSNSTTTAQQPNSQQNTADRSSNTNVNASVNINDQQLTRISTSISHLNVQPLTNVNFSLLVGTVVPRDVRLQQLPAEVVEIVPQHRGYDFVLVKDEIVIVEPSSYKIVAVLPLDGGRAGPNGGVQGNVQRGDREVGRKHAKARPVELEKRVTTGSTVRTEIRTGARVLERVEIEAFPEEVYRDAPTLREYRYINRDSHTYIVEPHERRIIEEID